MSRHVNASPTEMAGGSSWASLLRLQGGYLGLMAHLSSDRGGIEYKNMNMGDLHAGTRCKLGGAWAHSPQRRAAVAAFVGTFMVVHRSGTIHMCCYSHSLSF